MHATDLLRRGGAEQEGSARRQRQQAEEEERLPARQSGLRGGPWSSNGVAYARLACVCVVCGERGRVAALARICAHSPLPTSFEQHQQHERCGDKKASMMYEFLCVTHCLCFFARSILKLEINTLLAFQSEQNRTELYYSRNRIYREDPSSSRMLMITRDRAGNCKQR